MRGAWLAAAVAALWLGLATTPAAAQDDRIDLPFTAGPLHYDETTQQFVVGTYGNSHCGWPSLRIVDLAGVEQHRIDGACHWLVDNGTLFVSTLDTIRSYSMTSGELEMQWELPEGHRARGMTRAGVSLYFDEETRSAVGLWSPSGVGSLVPGVQDSLGTGGLGEVRLGAASSDGRFLWIVDRAGIITRFDQAGQTHLIEMPVSSESVGSQPLMLSADEQRIYSGNLMFDASTLEVLERADRWHADGFVERADGRVLAIGTSAPNGFVDALRPDTLDVVATGGYVRSGIHSGNAVADAIVVDHPVLGERLAVAAENSIVFQSLAPELGVLGHPLEAGVARTTTLGASWISAIDSITIGGTPVPFRPIDYDYNGTTDAFEVDVPELTAGQHVIGFDGPLGPSEVTAANTIDVGPAQPRTTLEVLIRDDSRPGDVTAFIACSDPNARYDESPDIYRSHQLSAGERVTYQPVIGHTCNIDVQVAEDPGRPLGYGHYLTAGFYDPTRDRNAAGMIDLERPSQEIVMTQEALGFGVFVPDPEETVLWTYSYGIGQVPEGERNVTIDCPGENPVTYATHYGWWQRTVVPSRHCTVTRLKPAGAEFSGWTEIELHLGTVEPVRNENTTRGIGHGPAVGLIALDAYPHPSEHNGAFVRQQYLDFLGRDGDPGGVAHWTASLDNGSRGRTDLVEQFLASAEFGGTAAPVNRLYRAYFDRAPDREGLFFWMNWIREGRSLAAVSDEFARSPEFTRTYGSLDDAAFVDLVYENVLGRAPDAAGRAFWADQMSNGLTRGQLMVNFSESIEFVELTASDVLVESLYQGLLQRSPDPQGFEYWTGVADSGAPLDHLIAGMLASDEYYDRFVNVIEERPAVAQSWVGLLATDGQLESTLAARSVAPTTSGP